MSARASFLSVVFFCAATGCGLETPGLLDAHPQGAVDGAAAATATADAATPADAASVHPQASPPDGGQPSFTCAPPPPWASDCNGAMPCISTLSDPEVCIESRTECQAQCAGAICCIVGDLLQLRCVTDPSLCTDG